MAGTTGVTIRVVSNRLPQIAAAVRPAVSAVVKRRALAIEATAKELANVKTGTMRRSIHTEFPTDLSAVIGPSVFYAIYQEFLHKAFMRPAAEQHLPGMAAEVRDVLRKL